MKSEILKILKKTEGFVSGQEISEKLSVSRTAVWKAVRQLEAEGSYASDILRRYALDEEALKRRFGGNGGAEA